MINTRPCLAWIVEFTEGVSTGQRKRLFLSSLDFTADKLISHLNDRMPNTKFTVYNIDAGSLVLPEETAAGDFYYQPDGRRVNQDLEVIVTTKADAEVTPDSEDEEVITFMPPTSFEDGDKS